VLKDVGKLGGWFDATVGLDADLVDRVGVGEPAVQQERHFGNVQMVGDRRRLGL